MFYNQRIIIDITALLTVFILLTLGCKDPEQYIQLVRVKTGDKILYSDEANEAIPFDTLITAEFNNVLDTLTVADNILLSKQEGEVVTVGFSYTNELRTLWIKPDDQLLPETNYSLSILDGLKGAANYTFPGANYTFTTMKGTLKLLSATINNKPLEEGKEIHNIGHDSATIELNFTHPLDPSNYTSFITLTGNYTPLCDLSVDNTSVTITPQTNLGSYKRYYLSISENLSAANGFAFEGYSASFFTRLDSSLKFPLITDEALLDLVQEHTFSYFYNFAHPISGLARERNTSGDLVTTGGTGFGLMAIIAGIERNIIPREDGMTHFNKVITFLEDCDRFHGAWPHWLNGNTGKTIAFSEKDDGADLVETAFLVQGLLTVRQYLNPTQEHEASLINRINVLWEEVEWDWFTRDGSEVLYWHWSPNHNWAMNMTISGYNEALIVYVLATSSPTYPINADVYHNGWARSGAIINGNNYYGLQLPLGYDFGGPLFFAHYSFLGLDPRNLSDQYANYLEQNTQHTLINRQHAIVNPNQYIGYSADCWGFTASDGNLGYSAHAPNNDRGVITPTAALSSMPFTPEASMDALKHFYYRLGDRLWGEYGFYDAFNITAEWYADSYLAIDQGPIVVMIENHRTRLLWDLFMSAPEVETGLTTLGFTYK